MLIFQEVQARFPVDFGAGFDSDVPADEVAVVSGLPRPAEMSIITAQASQNALLKQELALLTAERDRHLAEVEKTRREEAEAKEALHEQFDQLTATILEVQKAKDQNAASEAELAALQKAQDELAARVTALNTIHEAYKARLKKMEDFLAGLQGKVSSLNKRKPVRLSVSSQS